MAPPSAHRTAALAVAGLLAAATLTTPHLGHVSAAVLAAFDGAPPAPQPISQHPEYGNYDIQMHTRDQGYWQQPEPMAAQHGANCSGPPATHPTSSYADVVFVCNDHLMTSLNATGYGVIYVTPNRIADLAGGSVRFDLSTEKMSGRDWWDVMITPWAQNLSVPLLSDLSQGVDLQGPPPNAISIATDNGQGAPVLKVVRNGAVQRYGSGGTTPALNQGVVAGTNQAAVRQTFVFTAANGRMKFERLASATAPALVYWDVAATATFTSGIVQFGHHSYNPTKDGAGVPATWHWDELTVANGTPFSIQHAAPRLLGSAGTVTFPAAPSNAFLRFSAICAVRVNGQLVAYQPSAEGHHPEHASSYFVPIPAGSTSAAIAFQADSWYTPSFGCHAKDFHVWSQSGAPPPTSTPTPTATPIGPTATPTMTPTATLTPTPGAETTITFDDKAGQNQPLNGQYPTGVIDWGTSNWWHSGPWGGFTTKSASFNGGGSTSKTFTFVTARRLVSLKAYNGGSGATTVTLACAGQTPKVQVVPAGQMATITTGWSATCTTVTVTSTNGWDTNFDDLVIA